VIHSRLTGLERFEIWEARGKRRVSVGVGTALGGLQPRQKSKAHRRRRRAGRLVQTGRQTPLPRSKRRVDARQTRKSRRRPGIRDPSAESLYHAIEGRYSYLSLPARIGGATLPRIVFVDLRKESLEAAFCSSYLVERLESNVREGHQSILFLNKRGHSRFIQCNACGWTARCKNCDIALIYHRVANRMKCHYCGYNRSAVSRCEQCGGTSCTSPAREPSG